MADVVKIDGKLRVTDYGRVAEAAARHEAAGYDGLWSSESKHDPFLPLVLAAEHTERIEIGTAIAVAFARSPMTVAYAAHDLQAYSGGRFMLGLGTQVKAHIERRFAMPWSEPARRMREYITALRAIWASWDDGVPLDFQGDFYSHTLMTPFFSPPPLASPPPSVHLAAVGERLTEVAGEVADGLLVHAFTTERYLRERTLPALERGLSASGRTRNDIALSIPGLVATGTDEESMARAVEATRKQVSFYGSTPAYRSVLEVHGWGELGEELTALSRSGDPQRWETMASLVTDEVLHEFAVVAEPHLLADAIRARFAGLIDRFSFYPSYEIDDAIWDDVVTKLSS
jgi:probable F420-dependent oxidoreductase